MTFQPDWLAMVNPLQRTTLVHLVASSQRSRWERANAMLAAPPLPADETDAEARAANGNLVTCDPILSPDGTVIFFDIESYPLRYFVQQQWVLGLTGFGHVGGSCVGPKLISATNPGGGNAGALSAASDANGNILVADLLQSALFMIPGSRSDFRFEVFSCFGPPGVAADYYPTRVLLSVIVNPFPYSIVPQ